METEPILILVSGLPCTGKTTIAKQITEHFHYPLIYKDGIKEILFDSLGCSSRAWSKKLSGVSYQIMFHLIESMLASGCSLVAEANFHPESIRNSLTDLRCRYRFQVFEVLCRTEGEVLLERFNNRYQSGKRHPGHLDQIVIQEVKDLINRRETGYLELGGGYEEVDTTFFDRVDYAAIMSGIKKY